MAEFVVKGYGHVEFTGLRRTLCPVGHALLLRLEKGSCKLADKKLPQGACVLLAGGAGAELYTPSGAQLAEFLLSYGDGFRPVAILESPPAEVKAWLAAPTDALPATLLQHFPDGNPPSPVLAGVREYIEQNYTGDVTLDGLAAYAGCSKYTLIRGFKANWGCTPMGYLAQVRLQNAQRLLTTTYVSVELVAELCGFSSASYLIACFKKAYGQTPHTYRQGNPL